MSNRWQSRSTAVRYPRRGLDLPTAYTAPVVTPPSNAQIPLLVARISTRSVALKAASRTHLLTLLQAPVVPDGQFGGGFASWPFLPPPVFQPSQGRASIISLSAPAFVADNATIETLSKRQSVAFPEPPPFVQPVPVRRLLLMNLASQQPLPSSPALTAVATGQTSVLLSWTASVTPSPHTILFYEIFRNGVLVAAASGASLSYTDTGLTAGAAYIYTVRALDSRPLYSPLSAPATATTAALPPPPTGSSAPNRCNFSFEPLRCNFTMSTAINERSQLPVRFRLSVAPATLRYRVYCETNQTEVVPWNTLTPALSGTIVIPATANRIINDANRTETRTIQLECNEGTDDSVNFTESYRIRNVLGKL